MRVPRSEVGERGAEGQRYGHWDGDVVVKLVVAEQLGRRSYVTKK